MVDFSVEGELSIDNLPLEIEDEPRFPYRGFMIDISREFYPVETLKRLISAIAQIKINALHVHLSDDDSMPLELPSFPHMTDHTAWTKDEVYTPADIREIIDHCIALGIKVIPEIDIPGHSLAFGKIPEMSEFILCKDKDWKHKM
jgi:hexosaminidase